MTNSVSDRMRKNYEAPARHLLINKIPVIVRVDGRAFHTYTRRLERPFDSQLMDDMVWAAVMVSKELQGFTLGYVQSDEASFLLLDTATHETQPAFGNVKSKIETIAASTMSAAFNFLRNETFKLATFDGRAFNIPENEVVNYFVWRAKDWGRNSLQMYCQSLFSHSEMQNKNSTELHQMLHEKGRNWAIDLTDQQKNGTFLWRRDDGMTTSVTTAPIYESINELYLKVKGEGK